MAGDRMVLPSLLVCAVFMRSTILGLSTKSNTKIKDLQKGTSEKIVVFDTETSTKTWLQKEGILNETKGSSTDDAPTSTIGIDTKKMLTQTTDNFATGKPAKSVNKTDLSTIDLKNSSFDNITSEREMLLTSTENLIENIYTIRVSSGKTEKETKEGDVGKDVGNNEGETNDHGRDVDEKDKGKNQRRCKRKRRCNNTEDTNRYDEYNFEIEFEGCFRVRKFQNDFTIPFSRPFTILRRCFSECNEKVIGIRKLNNTTVNCYCLEDDDILKENNKIGNHMCKSRCSLEKNYSCGGRMKKQRQVLSIFKGDFKESAPSTILPYEEKIGEAVGITIGVVVFVFAAVIAIICGLKRYKSMRAKKNSVYEESDVYDHVDYNEIATSCSIEGSSNVHLLNGAYMGRNPKRNQVNEHRAFLNVATDSITEMDEGTYHKLSRTNLQSPIAIDNMDYLMPREVIRPPTYLEVIESSPKLQRRYPDDAVPNIPEQSPLDRVSGAYYIVEKKQDTIPSKELQGMEEKVDKTDDYSTVWKAQDSAEERSDKNKDADQAGHGQEVIDNVSSKMKDSSTSRPHSCAVIENNMPKKEDETLLDSRKEVGDDADVTVENILADIGHESVKDLTKVRNSYVNVQQVEEETNVEKDKES